MPASTKLDACLDATGRLFLRHAAFGAFLFQPRIEFFDHLFRPLRINLTRSVFTFAQHRVAPLVDQVVHFSVVGEFLSQLWRNESDSLGIADRDVAGHDANVSDANGNVDASEHDIFEGGRVDSAGVDLESGDLLNSGDIANRAVHDQAVVTLGEDCRGEIVADDCAVANFPEKVDDENIAGLENIDDPGIFVADAMLSSSIRFDYRIHVRAPRHKNGGYHAADESLTGINHLPSALELVAISGVLQEIPGFVGGDVFQTGEHIIGNVWTAVGKAIAMPLGSELDALFFGEKIELAVCGRGQRDGYRKNDCGAKRNCSRHGVRRESLKSRVVCESLAKVSQGDDGNNRRSVGGERVGRAVGPSR